MVNVALVPEQLKLKNELVRRNKLVKFPVPPEGGQVMEYMPGYAQNKKGRK